VLVESSDESWTQAGSNLVPKPNEGFPVPPDAKTGKHAMAVALSGRFNSFFADKPSPLFAVDANPEGDLVDKADRTGRTLKVSTPDARLVVVSSSEFVADMVTQMARQIGGGQYRGNPILVRNAIDWSLADTDLLAIRSAGAFARTLAPLDSDARTLWELSNYLIVLLALAAVLGLALTRRRMTKPITLTPEA
jgi:ABC-2 type transport system permease protein